MRKLLFGVALSAFTVLVCPRPVSANAVYTYTGNPFIYFNGLSCPPHCAISGSFTVASPLPANFIGNVTPISFSFSDGVGGLTIDSADVGVSASFANIQTDASGNIVEWDISLALGSDYIDTYGPVVDLEKVAVGSNTAGRGFPMGIWSFQGTTGQTPEPSSLLLLATGLLGLGPFLRRRLML